MQRSDCVYCGNPINSVEIVDDLRSQLSDREIEAKAKDLLIETQRAALTSQQWVIDSLKVELADREAEIAVLKDASIIINKNRDELVQQLADREERLALWRELYGNLGYTTQDNLDRLGYLTNLRAKGEI